MTLDAVTAGMTPYRPSPPPSSPPSWRTPSCADDMAAWFGRAASPPPALPLPAAGGGVPDLGSGIEGAFLAERHPGGWTCVRERWATDAERQRVLDHYLSARERAVYERLRPAVRPSWLLGRVAAKDAVRWWLADRGTRVDPVDVPLANEPSGRPVIDVAASPVPRAWQAIDLRLSIAHVTGTGVAIVAQGTDVGIDVEEAAPRPPSFARVAFSLHERRERTQRLQPGVSSSAVPASCACAGEPQDPHVTMDEVTWMAAAWTAKEAAGKAAGTGLQGRPTRFVTRLVGPDLFTVGERLVRCHRLDPVEHCSFAGHSLVVGWTLSVDRDIDLVVGEGSMAVGGGPGRYDALLAAGAEG